MSSQPAQAKTIGAQRRHVYVRGIDSAGYGLLDEVRDLRAQPRVIHIREKPWRGGPQSYSTGMLDASDDTIQSLHIHQELLAPGSITEKHGHQSEALFYILEGRGHDIHDGQRIEWQAGDVVLIPGSCVHQHFNGEAHCPARALAIKAKPLFLLLGLTLQYDVIEKPKEHSSTSIGFKPEYWPSQYAHEEAAAYARGQLTARYYDERIGRLKAEPSAGNGHYKVEKQLLKPEEMPWEDSAHGKLKHLLNERMETASTAIDMYIQEIAPGSCSGKHVHTAEEAFFVIEGRGYDLHWDMEFVLTDRYERRLPEQPRRFDWQAGDLVVIPSIVAHQHFNSGAERARILSIQCRTYKYLGYDDVEQLEDVPRS